MHDEQHFVLGNHDGATRVRFSRLKTAQIQRGTFVGRALGVVTYIQRIKVLRIVINQMLAGLFVEVGRSLAHVDKLIEFYILSGAETPSKLSACSIVWRVTLSRASRALAKSSSTPKILQSR